MSGSRWELPRWRVYRWVDRDDSSIIGTAYYFGRDVSKADMPYMEDMGIEGWCDLASDLLYRLQGRISSFVENTATQPISWAAHEMGNLAGWFRVRTPK